MEEKLEQQNAGEEQQGGNQDGGVEVQKQLDVLNRQNMELTKKAEILDSMLQDPRFQSWLETETTSGEVTPQTPPQPVPNQQQGGNDLSSPDAIMEELRRENPEIARAIDAMSQGFNQQINEKIGGVQKSVQQTQYQQAVDRSAQEINAMRGDTENYPLFNQVWTDMAKILQNNRAGSLKDAYTLAVAETVPLNRIAMKANANMAQGSQGSVNKNVSEKIYNSVQDAAKAAIADMGWGELD